MVHEGSAPDHSFVALRATRECVIGIPSVELAEKAVAIGNCSGREVDKFATFRLMPKKALRISAPLITECFADIECRVVDTLRK
jgi:flavin reductase (DIM6/NTAB) family NADH-FMN oxidoreductase RutF